jgi:prepilin-type N-terminal cleavage/methylation domain-containing protein
MHIKRSGCGFTLIEVLVSIGVIGVLVALALPALSSVRRSADVTRSLANLGTIAVNLEQYGAAYKDAFPYIAPGQRILITPEEDENTVWLVFEPYWDFSLHWPAVMHGISPWRESFMAWVSPRSNRRPAEPWSIYGARSGLPSYELMQGLFARPEVWDAHVPLGEDPRKVVYRYEVSQSAQKVAMMDTERAYLGGRSSSFNPALFCDGHARTLDMNSVVRPGTNRISGSSRPCFDTERGVRGVDVQ